MRSPSLFISRAILSSSIFATIGSAQLQALPPDPTSFDIFTNATVPAGLSTLCTETLIRELECSMFAIQLDTLAYVDPPTLEVVCTATCKSELQQLRGDIETNCDLSDTIEYHNAVIPVLMYADILLYKLELSCLKDGTLWCQSHLADLAAFNDPDSGHPFSLDTPIPTAQPDPCHVCVIENLRYQVSSPLFAGELLRSASAYESLTSSCSATTYPPSTITYAYMTPTGNPSVTTTAQPAPTCAGTTYTIQPGDDCNSIAQSEGISTGWLISDNHLQAFCHDFPTSGELCLVNKCPTYTILEGDTCDKIADEHEISFVQLVEWNPVLDVICRNIVRLVGTELCVDVPGGRYTIPSTMTIGPTAITTPAPPPTDIAAGTNTYCGMYHVAVLGEYCNLLVMRYGISLPDFQFLNPAINENCTNLFAEESYCVKPVGDINTYSGKIGYVDPATTTIPSTTTASTRTRTDKFAALPDATWIQTEPFFDSPTPEDPLAEGTRKDCYHYVSGTSVVDSQWQNGFSKTACEFVANIWEVTLEEFGMWNPSVGDATLLTCELQSGLRYCARYTDEPKKVIYEEEEEEEELPIRAGSASVDCLHYTPIFPGETCAETLELWEITIETFYALNPEVGADCLGFWPNYRYCVISESTATTSTGTTGTGTTTSSTTTTSVTPPVSTHPGQPANCNAWHVVETGDDCPSIIALYSLSAAEFFAWNPAVDTQCTLNFWLGFAYCIGIGEQATTTATTTTPPTTTTTASTSQSATGTTTTSPTAPGPTHTGQPATCNKWHIVQPGQDCLSVTDINFITIEQFFLWNPSVNAECTLNFWLDYAYCVSIDGFTTTRGSTTTTTTQQPPTTTTTQAPVVTPTPIQDNSAMPNCNAFALPLPGDWCAKFAERHGISVAQLSEWNMALGVDGADCGNMFWGGYYYCIGVST